jgi:predicted RNA-binding protein with TRAM domain
MIAWEVSVVQALGDERTSYGRGGGFGRSGYGGSARSEKPKPVEVGKEYDVTITESSRRGDGVAKIDGFVIFVTGGKQGEKTRIKITQVGPRFANATIVGTASQSTS